MIQEPYRPSYESRGVRVSHEIALAGGGDNAPMTLTCRWPDGAPPRAFVVFCHGLGGNGRAYAELSGIWAAHGYLVIHPTFPDNIDTVAAAEPELGLDPAGDLSGWTANTQVRTRMLQILHTPHYWMERIRIVRQVLDAMKAILAATCGEASLPSPGAMPGAIAGHSFGAYTSQLLTGAEIDVPGQGAVRFRDDRFRAAILLSTQGRDQQGLRDGSWDQMTGPVMTVTGTLDRGAKGQDWRWKSEPYELAPPGGKYLAVLEDAGHYLGGVPSPEREDGVVEQREAVNQLTLAFLDAQLMKDDAARAWLASIGDHVGDCPLLFKRK